MAYGAAPLEELFADLLIRRAESGFIYRCRRCHGTLLSPNETTRCGPSCGGTLALIFAIAEGGLTYWNEGWRRRPVRWVREALRRRPTIELAVLYGSRARREEEPLSDIDLVVDWDRAEATRLWGQHPEIRLARGLSRPLGLKVEIASLTVLRRDPIIFAEVLGEGVVLVDRHGRWPALQAEQPAVEAAADEASKELHQRARQALDDLAHPGKPN